MVKENSKESKKVQKPLIIIALIIIAGVIVLGGLTLAGLFIYSNYLLKKAEIENSKNTTQPTSDNATKNNQNDNIPSDWLKYQNSRFEFTVYYPNTFTKTESANGDGASLTMSTPPISINVFGKNNTSNQSVDEYLNEERASLFAGAYEAEEIEAKDASQGNCSGSQRLWKYTSPIDGSESIEARTTCLSGETFYTVEMIIAYLDFSEYSEMYDKVIKNFKID